MAGSPFHLGEGKVQIVHCAGDLGEYPGFWYAQFDIVCRGIYRLITIARMEKSARCWQYEESLL